MLDEVVQPLRLAQALRHMHTRDNRAGAGPLVRPLVHRRRLNGQGEPTEDRIREDRDLSALGQQLAVHLFEFLDRELFWALLSHTVGVPRAAPHERRSLAEMC
jgi:hypothetical protein